MSPKDFEVRGDLVAEPREKHQQGMSHEQLVADIRASKIRALREQAAYQVREWTRAGYRIRKGAEEEVYQQLLAKFLEKEAENEARRARQEEARRRQAQDRLAAAQRREQQIEDAIDQGDEDQLRAIVRAQRQLLKDLVAAGKIRPYDVPPELR